MDEKHARKHSNKQNIRQWKQAVGQLGLTLSDRNEKMKPMSFSVFSLESI